jgi:ketosteroid isomerase-like protein
MHDLETLDAAWNLAYQRNDLAALEAILAPDWIGFMHDGSSVTRAQLLEQLPRNPKATLEFSGFELHVFGETGVTRGWVRIVGADFEVKQRFVRVWARRDAHWQAVAVHIVQMQA